MSMTHSGTVEQIIPREVNKRDGSKGRVYDAIIDGTKVSCGFKKPSFEVGEAVSLPVENTQWGLQLERGSTGTKQTTSDAVPSKGDEFPVPFNSRSFGISRQSSLKAAVETVTALPGAFFRGREETATAEDVFNEIIEIAYKFHDYQTGHRELNMAIGEKDD